MKAKAYKQPGAWRAIFAALTLLFSNLSPAMSLATSKPEACEMACCMAKGHCCCAARKPWVKGRKTNGRIVIEAAEIKSQSCDFCAPSSSSNFISREIAQPAANDFGLARRHAFGYHNPLRAHRSIWFTPTPPRAPPALFI
ncbi:MAG: hypothetical protein J2P21_12800 [Chloracidobacterium sp.]|nr:hypothetical protein [Chloracidobacterium sp.]